MAEKKEAEKKAPEKPAPAEEKVESASKRKKINRLTLAEIEAKIEQLKATPGGMQTRYAHHLTSRESRLKK